MIAYARLPSSDTKSYECFLYSNVLSNYNYAHSGFDMECPFGKWCYGPQTQCTKLVSTKFCGTSFEDASSKCQRECSTGKHSECDVEKGESCFDGTSCDIESMSENRRGIPNPANHFCGR